MNRVYRFHRLTAVRRSTKRGKSDDFLPISPVNAPSGNWRRPAGIGPFYGMPTNQPNGSPRSISCDLKPEEIPFRMGEIYDYIVDSKDALVDAKDEISKLKAELGVTTHQA
jgi:hypothetical protein